MDYTNAGSFLPQLGYKPEGFLGGHLYAQQEQDYRQKLALSNLQQQIAIGQSGANLQDYLQAAPHRQSGREFDMQKNAAYGPIQGQLAQGEAATAQGKVQQVPLQTQAMKLKNQKEKSDYLMDQLGSHAAALLGSGMPAAEVSRAFTQRVIPQIEQIIGERLPDEFRNPSIEQLLHIRDFTTNDAKTRSSMRLEMMKQEEANYRNDTDAQAAIEVAKLRAEAGVRERYTSAAQRDAVQRQLEEAYFQDEFKSLLKGLPTQPGQGESQGKRGFSINEQQFNELRAEATRLARMKAIHRMMQAHEVKSDLAGPTARAEAGGKLLGSMEALPEAIDRAGALPLPENPTEIKPNTIYRHNGAHWRLGEKDGQMGLIRLP